MVFLGLVGAPAGRFTYEAYKALKALSPAAASLFAASETAAVGALLANTAAVLGAGGLGFFIGDQILKQLERTESMPDPGDYYEVGDPAFFTSVVFDYFVGGTPVFIDTPSIGFLNPVRGTFVKREGNSVFYYVIDGNGTRQNLVSTVNPPDDTRLIIKGFIKRPGTDPVTPTKKLPSYTPVTPNRPTPVPTTIPIPGYPAFPITPTPVETPANDPNEDDKFVDPGITIKVPELGLQIQYTPTGVRIGRYTDNDTKLFAPPPPEYPTPPKNAAEEPCPCPDDSKKVDEIICRVKTLQSEILNDGYDFTTTIIPEGTGGSATDIQDELTQANVFITQFPSNISHQNYQAVDSNVIFAGWFSWTKEGRAGERIPLCFENNSFYPPPECDGFKYAFNRGVQGSGSFVTRRKKDYVDNC